MASFFEVGSSGVPHSELRYLDTLPDSSVAFWCLPRSFLSLRHRSNAAKFLRDVDLELSQIWLKAALELWQKWVSGLIKLRIKTLSQDHQNSPNRQPPRIYHRLCGFGFSIRGNSQMIGFEGGQLGCKPCWIKPLRYQKERISSLFPTDSINSRDSDWNERFKSIEPSEQ
ncbi:hypothetical protein RF11_10383 [Thelohanellus kitauei]|uniref:Uncharacterized protein n=1 Tax=Thelohanellus kitauei TaxID=669202 RepID=A0A0C2MZA6_THEKT|nr:hypothetical protein RF11_10383 [Thelohanellus kitauei]